MHARVSTGEVQPGKKDEFVNSYRDSAMPANKQQRGFKGQLLLTDPNTVKAISITLWETEADLRASEPQYAKVAHALAGPPVREIYEVSAGESTLGKGGATHARVNYRQIQPDRMDEAISMYRDSVMPVVSARRGCVGGFVLTDGSTGKLVAVSLWESEADMRASQPPGDVDAIAGGPPVREIYEVSVQV